MQIRSKKCTEMCNKKYFLEKRDDKMGNEVLQPGKKFCKHCGQQIDKDCVVCPVCGKQVEDLKSSQQPVVINNTNANTNSVDVKMENRGT